MELPEPKLLILCTLPPIEVLLRGRPNRPAHGNFGDWGAYMRVPSRWIPSLQYLEEAGHAQAWLRSQQESPGAFHQIAFSLELRQLCSGCGSKWKRSGVPTFPSLFKEKVGPAKK